MDEHTITQRDPADRMPYNVEAEAALLGALMIDNRFVDEVMQLSLAPAHFYEPLHGRIFETIQAKVAKSETANPVTLKPYFELDAAMREIGGPAYLAQLTGSGAALIGARDFAQQIIDLANLRLVIGIATRAIERCEDTSQEIDAHGVAADMENELVEALTAPAKKSTVTFGEAIREATKRIEDVGNGEAPSGFRIGRYTDWNAVVGRMEPEDFILLGGRPSMGKTAVGATVALGAAEGYPGEPPIGTDFLSLEMSREKAIRRMIAELIYEPTRPLPYQDLVDGKLRREHWRALVNAQADLDQLPLTISDPSLMFVEDLAPHIRKRQREFQKRFGIPLQLCVLDYLGRLQTRRKLQGTTEIVSHISRTVKSAAKETGVAIVALAQLSRAVEQRDNKRPMLADLRDSGSLEQDADTVAFVYREAYYLRQVEPKRDQEAKWQKWADELEGCKDDMELYTSKRREGALIKRVSKFIQEYQAVLDHNDAKVAGSRGLFDDDFPEMRG